MVCLAACGFLCLSRSRLLDAVGVLTFVSVCRVLYRVLCRSGWDSR
jgi:hypothetical protein